MLDKNRSEAATEDRFIPFVLRLVLSRGMTARRADLSCVVVAETARSVQHQARVLGTFTVLNEDRMPAAAVRAVDLIAWLQRMCHAIKGTRTSGRRRSRAVSGRRV